MKTKNYFFFFLILFSSTLQAQKVKRAADTNTSVQDTEASEQNPLSLESQENSTAEAEMNVPPLDAAYTDLTTKDRQCIPYSQIRDADVFYRQRIWRIIDLREKANFHLYYPLEIQSDYMSLFDLLKKNIEDGAIQAYKAELGPNQQDDKFTVKLSKSDLEKTFLLSEGDVETDANGRELKDQSGNVIRDDKVLLAEHIVYYKLKEDWVFDSKRSRMEARIIGLAPMKPLFDPLDKKKIIGYTEVFWVYFPAIRNVLCVNNAVNTKNSSQKRSFDDIFSKRLFTSLIVKTDYDNPYNRNIADYKKGFDALLEAEKVKKILFNFEHDLWEY
jgi:gliding motility associated protien GldN